MIHVHAEVGKSIRSAMVNNMDEFKFNELTKEFITAYRQFLLCAYMHKDVTSEIYHRNKPTWDMIIRSLDLNSTLSLAKIFEKYKDIGRPFDDEKLNDTRKRILNFRDELIAHFDVDTLRNIDVFLKENRIYGTDGLLIIEALKNRFLGFQKSYKFRTDVENLFRQTTNETVSDFNKWFSGFSQNGEGHA